MNWKWLPLALSLLGAPAFGAPPPPVPPGNGGTGVANNAASTIGISGAHALVMTLSGATALTLPTSGTVLSSANLSAQIDSVFGSAQGDLLYRGASVWTVLAPGTSGYFLETLGASANPAWAPASGGSGCTISGGAQYQIVVNNGSSGCSSSANASVEVGALALGQSGTLGSVAMGNATSGTVTLEPVTGALASAVASLPANTGTIAELNLAQTYSAAQTFTNGDLLLKGSSSGAMTLEAPSAASTYVVTFPAATDTVDVLGTAQTFTAAKTFTSSDLSLLGSSTGATTFASANAGASNYTITVPALTGTLLTTAGNGSALTGLTWSQIGSTPTTLAGYGITNALSTSLANTNILVGNGSGNAAAVAVSGDATLANTGALTVTKSNGSSFGSAAFSNTGTSGATVPLNNGNNNSSGNNTHSGQETFTGTLVVPGRVITASGPVTVSAATDYFICINKSAGAATTVNLPSSPATWLTYLIKDCKGDAATNNITITPAAGNIDGASTYVISNNYGSVAVTYNGTSWSLN